MNDPPSVACYDAAFSPDTGKSHLLLADLSKTHFETDGRSLRLSHIVKRF
jgi:hypothetical protein